MKQIIPALIIGLISFTTYGQVGKELVISIATGKLTSPYYLKSKFGAFYNIDFDYHLSQRNVLSVNYNDGVHNYYDNVRSTDPNYIKSDGTNSKANYRIFSVLYKYKFLNGDAISGAIGTGAGIMTHSLSYPFVVATGSNFRESTWSDLVFPVRFEFDYKISKSFRLGVIGGFYVHPEYPILAYHVGTRFGYILK
ncbi:MAG: hypothetical protein Q8L07_11875 [Sediminibacterium sp.]|nr:hypothetical protein [Sediminibacterium sp.]